MSLTLGTAPFGRDPQGTFNFEPAGPGRVLYFESSPRRVRVTLDGVTVADSVRMKLLHESGHLPVYYFPLDDVDASLLETTDTSTHCPLKGDASYFDLVVGERRVPDAAWTYPDPVAGAPFLAGYVAFFWDAVDHWYEEDEEIIVHAPDPYHRIDVRSGSRHVVVSAGGRVVADTKRPKLLFETGLPTRYYILPEDVDLAALKPSATTTQCPYKGTADYFSIAREGAEQREVAWRYRSPSPEVAPIAGLICFFNERCDIEVDGVAEKRPTTQWS